jgi:hypothetical protein
MDAATRQQVILRADGRCEYCLLPDHADEWPFHVEHIIAKQHCGDDTLDNLCWSCSRCNLHKGPNLVSIEMHTNERVPLFDPRRDDWKSHFLIDGARIVGITATDRVTVRLLNMNAIQRVELRRELIELGQFET